jgi:hypothetical protein
LLASLRSRGSPRLAPLDADSFQRKFSQSHRVALASLGEGYEVVGDNLRDRVITISQPQIFQCAFERINQDSTVHCKVPIVSVVDYKAEFASSNGQRRQW